MKNYDHISSVVEEFWAYKSNTDESDAAEPAKILQEFSRHGEESISTSISKFVVIVECPYRVLNHGAGMRANFSDVRISRMAKGTAAHRVAESNIIKENERIQAEGGTPDAHAASAEQLGFAHQDLREATEVPLSFGYRDLVISGKVDGLKRLDGDVIAIERKPRTRMYHPSARLQAMLYAIGSCIWLEKPRAFNRARWVVTSYNGAVGPNGMLTENALSIIRRLVESFLDLSSAGSNGKHIEGLLGPTAGKCRNCEYFGNCRHKVENTAPRGNEKAEPVWVKYANKRRNRDDAE